MAIIIYLVYILYHLAEMATLDNKLHCYKKLAYKTYFQSGEWC